MKLVDSLGADRALFAKAGFALPSYDRAALVARTRSAPEWVHFGAGNIFRAFLAAAQQRVIEAGASDTGIVVVGGHDFEVIDRGYRPYDNLSLLVTLRADGTKTRTVIGSITESLVANPATGDWSRLREIFRNASLKMVSLTVTEKGYSLVDGAGEYRADVLRDFSAGPAAPSGTMGRLAALCNERYLAGGMPIALVSMDNCARNGDLLRSSLIPFANAWIKAGFSEPGFLEWLTDPSKVGFPWTMIDKITPRPDETVARELAELGLEDTTIARTAHGAFVAPFVNAEAAEYLAIEDSFPNGRPPLEKGGVLFADRETVERIERMKVGTCLNPLHTALAIFGCLLGYERISAELRDPELHSLVERIGYDEGLPVAVDPGIVSPREFIREVIEERLPNPFLPDTPQRIACDTSQKIRIRFGGTIRAWADDPSRDAASLTFIPLVLAGWCRYLMGVDDGGRAFEPSPDPLLERCRAAVSSVSLGDAGPFGETLRPLLSDTEVFGADLYAVGLADKVTSYFGKMVTGPGAVRELLVSALA